MKKLKFSLFAALIICAACSRGEEYEKKPNPRGNNVLIKAIRTPLNQATAAKMTADKRTDSIDQEYRSLEELDEKSAKELADQ